MRGRLYDRTRRRGFGGDAGTAPISDCGTAKRLNGLNIPFDRATGSLPADGVESLSKAGGTRRAHVTHRRLRRKPSTASSARHTNVERGGPKVTELWERFGS